MKNSLPLKLSSKVKKMHSLATKVCKNAYAPYTRFPVGACIEDVNGDLHTGCNVENACHAGVCAERTAMFSAVAKGVKRIKSVVVVTPQDQLIPPCGVCLQVLIEFCDEDFEVFLGDFKGIKRKHLFKDLMPFAYSPKVLKQAKKF